MAFQVSFLNITGFRDFPLGDLPMLQVWCRHHFLSFQSSISSNII